MRVFQNYRDLSAALALPADAAGAYRFLDSFGAAGFVCAQCRQEKPFKIGGGTGYAIDRQDDVMLCYACADSNQRIELRESPGPFYGYVSGDGKHFTTWTGGELGTIVDHWTSYSTFGRETHHYRVRDVHGAMWFGRNAGYFSGPGCALTVRRVKR